MSIFGVKRKHVDALGLKQEIFNMRSQAFTQINTLNDRHTGLQNRVRDMNINHRLLYNKVDTSPQYITVWAEKRGSLGANAFEFGFGNAGRDAKTGYMMMSDGSITDMSLNVNKEFGRVWVKLAIDGQEQDDGILLEKETVSNYIKFDTPIPVKAGSIISFISKVSNPKVVNCVVSVLIKI